MKTSTSIPNKTENSVIAKDGKQNVLAKEVAIQFEKTYTSYPEEIIEILCSN
tara:strand:+ start:69 stop:224 length:156 start_codon:yes stop_codon:yes gene_type:complete